MEKSITTALSLWDSAGERPHELLAEYDLYEYLLDNMSNVTINNELYRGSNRYYGVSIGDKINYKDAKSWSFELETAKNFVDGTANPTILVLDESVVTGIINGNNTYNEDEIILAPMILQVVSVKDIEGHRMVRVVVSN